MGMREWRGMHAARDETREMRHIDEEIGADLIGDLPESRQNPNGGDSRSRPQ